MKLLKCPKCGELFSDSYKECPFCAEDEELAQGGKARHGRRIQRQKSPSIGGPVLVIVIVFLAAFLVYAFFGDKISSLFEKTDKPSVEDVTPAPSPTPDTSVTLTLDQQTLTLVEGGSTKLTVSGADADWGTWVYRALTFLVISCPCALVISIPLSFFAGLGGAGKEGVLIKGSNYLEALSQTKTVVFDKTGTLTQGVFEVSAVHHSPMAQEKLLEYAALAECASSHPISKSLQKAAGGALDRSRVTDIQEHSGRGVTAVVDGVTVAAGNGKLMEELGVAWHECHSVGTIVHIAVNGEYAGHIVISDVEKPHSRDAIAALKAAGVTKTVMLTGDIQKVADYVARDLGVDEVRAELLPADKVARVEELLKAEPEGAKLAFVGDGINDAPVLSRADIGIAMGAMGSDAAIEAADVVLMDDDPMKIAKAIKISRKCIRIVHENIVFSLGVKLLCLLLVALGFANMWMGIFADVGVMVLAVLNAIRALRVHNL